MPGKFIVPTGPVRSIGSPKAHVIGTFDYEGQLFSEDRALWRAEKKMSLKSYFLENWHLRLKHPIEGAEDNPYVKPYGTRKQIIFWTTTLNGELVK